MAVLTLLGPAFAFAAAPQEAPLPERPPATGEAAPAGAPKPLPRPGSAAAERAPAEAGPPAEAVEMEPPRPRPATEATPEAVPQLGQTEELVGPSARGPGVVAVAPVPPPRPGLTGSSLIGIFSLTTGRTALLRFPTGDVRRVSVGDRIDGWEVSSITAQSLRVTRQGRERTFMLLGN